MKSLLSIICMGLLLACKSQGLVFKDSQNFKLLSNCPKEGECKLEVKNGYTYKSIQSHTKNEPELKENGSYLTFMVEYSKDGNPNLSDDFYVEKVLFTLPKEIAKQNYIDNELTEINLMYSRFCYCKGNVGYYPISNGKMQITENEINLSFRVNSKPQKISSFSIQISKD